ncbi:cytochrome P450 [Rathayibacter iranicus]|uniref:Cytochrome P450 n=1 Tax=Rathayibacter iranicus NCPPB 2253 = VKM Ac-1602 TaxID=1328868 RepID=A0ABX5LDB0_9MICO|nr:cytochrome P450 [Rathayibacter iranicus] [Rathayibacter iranicus NCPPB 2253 = VKM Ac-1602]
MHPRVRRLPMRELPTTIRRMRGDLPAAFRDLSSRFPEGVALPLPGKDIVVLGSAGAQRRVLIENAANYVKGLGQAEIGAHLGPGVLTADGEVWQRHRSPVVARLRSRRVAEMSGTVLALAERSISSLVPEGEAEAVVDLTLPLAQYTLDCLSAAFDLPPIPAAEVVEALDVFQDAAMFESFTLAAVPARWRRRADARLREADAALHALCSDLLAGLGPQARNEGWADEPGLRSLLLAGYETTATSLAWAVLELAQAPETRHAIAQEAQSAVPVLERRVAARFFAESVRARPPVWLISRRAMADDVVDGHTIRAGDEVVLPVGTPQHEAQAIGQPSDLTFGLGPRGCPGKRLADVEGTAWLSVLLGRYEIEDLSSNPLRVQARMTQIPRGGVRVRLRGKEVPGLISDSVNGIDGRKDCPRH